MEDEIHFKNQEIKEFLAEIKNQEEKIRRLEGLILTPQSCLEDPPSGTISNIKLQEQLKLQVNIENT